MSKVTYRFLQGVKQEIHKETYQNQQSILEETDMFSDDFYNSSDTAEAKAEAKAEAEAKAKTEIEVANTLEDNVSDIEGFDNSMYSDNNSDAFEDSNTDNNEDAFEDSNADNNSDAFEDSLYTSQGQQEIERKNTDEFIQYSIDFKNKVSAKEARTSIESRLPFIVDKADFKSFTDQKTSNKNKKSAIIRETDSIYKSQIKMRKSGLTSEQNAATPERIGFIRVTKSPQLDKNFNTHFKSTRAKRKTRKLESIVGILNERFIIHKKKGFNKKKVGYLPVELADIQTLYSFDNITEDEINSSEKHSKSENERAYYDRLFKQHKILEREQEREQGGGVQRYVEIVEDRGIGQYIFVISLVIVILFAINTLKNSSLADGWSLENLNIIKTEEQTIKTETNIELSMNATPTLKNNELNINLTSEEIDGLSFTVELIDDENKETIYKSEELPSGTEIDTIFIENSLYDNKTDDNIYREATVRCETFKEGKYIGEIEQQIEIKIKPITK